MTDLDKAREWAEEYKGFDHLTHRVKAAIDVIQSLPDQWVDAEKVRDLIELYKHARDANAPGTEGRVINDLVIGNLEDLLSPKLPTLADMTQEEREACQWMQADWASFDGRESERVIVVEGYGKVINRKAEVHGAALSSITPRPDLPKLEWPGGGDAPTIAQKEKVTADQQSNSSETPKSSIKPEDVLVDELWLVGYRGSKWIGTRNRVLAPDYTWRVTSLNGTGSYIERDSEITLIHKLVPEPPALPEGMRLADHEAYGRVVVSPRVDGDGDYKIFRSTHDDTTGSDWGFAHESELTFLDGADA